MTLLVPTAPPPAVAYPADGSVRPVGRYVWEPIETAPLPATASPGLRGRRVAVLGGRETEAYALGTRLSAAGAHVHRLAPPRAEEAAGDDGVAAFLAGAGGRLDGIVDLGPSVPFTPAADTWEPAFRQTFRLLQAVHADWSAETDAERLFYLPVTRLGGLMGFGPADDPADRPLGGLWAGLAKGLPREIPNCNIRVLDLGPKTRWRRRSRCAGSCTAGARSRSATTAPAATPCGPAPRRPARPARPSRPATPSSCPAAGAASASPSPARSPRSSAYASS